MERPISTRREPPLPGITQVTVAGYKSVSEERSIEVRPLTILAGANSSGKSSIMQPLLLLKQTLEATYDPGALLLNGPIVRFTSAEQLLSHTQKSFRVGVRVGRNESLEIRFSKLTGRGGFEVSEMTSTHNTNSGQETIGLHPSMSHEEILSIFPVLKSYLEDISHFYLRRDEPVELIIARQRCFLEPTIKDGQESPFPSLLLPYLTGFVEQPIRELIHLPGLRGNPERTYPVTAVGSAFPGTFESYTASVIALWQNYENSNDIKTLGENLKRLGLTWKVSAKPIDDTQVELRVGRLPQSTRGGASDMVSIADVGVGVSQSLPVLVALLVAKPGQLVYLEQPEIHLHPRAQFAMAQILADAAKRGVRVVAETHSNLLLLGVQTLVAEGLLSPNKVKLHWFERDKNGSTKIDSADLDDAGSFGNWSEDFGQIALEAESRYLDAAERHAQLNM